jgi:transposase
MIHRLLEALRLENEIYEQILLVAQDQFSALARSDLEAFLDLMDKRAELIDRFTAIDGEIKDLKSKWHEIRRKSPPELTEQAVSLIRDQERLVRSILDLDKKSEGRLFKMVTALKKTRAGLADIAKAGRAYIENGVSSGGRFFDKKG